MTVNNRKGIFYTILSLAFLGLACNFVLGTEPTLAPLTTDVVIPLTTNTSESPPTLPEDLSDQTPLPSVATETAQLPNPTPTNPPSNVVAVTAINGYPDIYGGWHIVGLITNNSDRTVDNVEVEIQISDADGNPLFNEITMALLYTLSPGEISPFTLWVSEELPNISTFNAAVVGQSSAEIERPEFEIRGERLIIDDEGDIHVTGELVNVGGQPLTVNGLAAAAFDANGEIVTADFMDVAIRYLDPGESGPFRVTMIKPDESVESVASYELYSDVVPAAAKETIGLIFSENQYSYIDTFDSFHLVGEITNNTEKILNISMIAAIYDAEGTVIDASAQEIFVSAAPGETLPFDFGSWGPLNYSADTLARADTYSVQWDPYWTWESPFEYMNLRTQNDNNQYDDFQGVFTGEVVNDSGDLISSAIVIVSLYDQASGEIIATDYTSIWEAIPDGGISGYNVIVDLEPEFDPESVEYVIIAKGELP